MTELPVHEVDGRRARRDRGRAAVVDALFALLEEGATTLRAEAIAERSGVSLSSLFRYFPSIDDLQQEAVERYFERFAPLFEIPALGEGPTGARIRRYVDARLRLYEAIAPIARLARARARDLPLLGTTLEQSRARLAGQVGVQFAPELGRRSTAKADDLLALVATMTSFEAWDLLTESHRRSRAQIRRAWVGALDTLLELRDGRAASGPGPPRTRPGTAR